MIQFWREWKLRSKLALYLAVFAVVNPPLLFVALPDSRYLGRPHAILVAASLALLVGGAMVIVAKHRKTYGDSHF